MKFIPKGSTFKEVWYNAANSLKAKNAREYNLFYKNQTFKSFAKIDELTFSLYVFFSLFIAEFDLNILSIN
ncbi:hypothetical protein BpHYR1_019566 [Brachionus plicatilis]|uniref:Uncharacterized protein n=1 Tax=Brachionus plicatilis TaxID=10195 RepID=A0A3M7Q2P8_BRAPC|nr:hypothetical protein BpHYR1_019566 [Brachionus plicatilis]